MVPESPAGRARFRIAARGEPPHVAFAQDDAAPAAADEKTARETRGEHARRMGGRAKLYTSLALLALLIAVIVALALDNRNEARLSWVVGDTQAPVIWIVLVAAIVGWLAGIVTGAVIRRRTRAPH
jgi:uncharacterized integral membrane protein